MKCSVFIATSLDGFIATPDGEIDWLLDPVYKDPDGGDFGYTDFINKVDVLVMGRKTFEKVLTFLEWPYQNVPVIVLSSGKVPIPDNLKEKVTVMNSSPEKVVTLLKAEGKKHIYVDGGKTIQKFLQSDQINEITLTQIPVLLGEGIPLFGSIGFEVPLKHQQTRAFKNGVVQSHYAI